MSSRPWVGCSWRPSPALSTGTFTWRAMRAELLWKVLTAKRWEILKALCGAGPVSIREAARRVGRDVKGVHGDVVALIEAGLINRTEAGAIEFPYEAVKVEFLLQAA